MALSPIAASPRRGQVITFYSFKGGVGRTMAVANVAAILAQRGKKVLALDFDFEAPGLHRYFLTESEGRYQPRQEQRGVLDFFEALRQRLAARWPEGTAGATAGVSEELGRIVGELLDSGQYLYRVQLANPNGKNAPPVAIDFIAAARFDEGFPKLVRSFDWQGFYDAYAEVFPAIARVLGERWDYALIDSRTGVTDIGSICTMMLPDKLVAVCSPNEQSLRGALEASWQAMEGRKAMNEPRPLPLFPLVSRIEEGEEGLKREWIGKVQHGFERLFEHTEQGTAPDLDLYFQSVRIPHRSFYAYGERVAAEEQPIHETGSLAQAYERFVRCIECADLWEARAWLELEQHAAKEAELAALDEIIRRFSDAPRLDQRVFAAMAMLQKSALLGESQRLEEALAICDEVLRRFADSSEPALQPIQADALINRGVALQRLGRDDEALAANEEVLRRFGEASEPALREQAASALNGVGFALLVQSKRTWQAGDEEEARRLLQEAQKKLDAARERHPEEPFILGNAGYIAFLLGREDEARELLAQALRLGSEELRQAELADADIHSLPQDEAFRALIRSLPIA